MADEKLRDSPGCCKRKQSLYQISALQNLDASSGGSSDRQSLIERRLIGRGDAGLSHICDDQLGMEFFSDELSGFDHLIDIRPRSDTYENSFMCPKLLMD